MFIVYEYAACVLAVSIGAALLFTACVMFLMLKERGRILLQTLHRFTHGGTWLIGRWMAAESRDS
jgi:hypothetical protein